MYYEKCLKLANFFPKNVKYESLDNKIKIGFFHSNPRQGVFSAKKFRFTFLLHALNKFKRINAKAALLCSSALMGTCLYISHRKQASCENNTNDSRKENMLDDVVPKLEEAVTESRDLIQRIKDEVGAPGIVVGVAVDGKMVWEEGLGFADVENRVLCSGNTVMRIASISKSITMAAVAKLWEEGKLDIDKPVQDYVPYFPQKTFNGEQVTITCRHLLSHLGGIRHYDKNILKNNADKGKIQKETKDNNNRNLEVNKSSLSTKTDDKPEKTEEFDMKEYYIKEKYDNIKSSLDLFKDDPLVSKPGSKFLYSTHGWTLVSSIVEAITKEQFHIYMTKLFKEFGMENTYLDVNDTIIYQRSRNYVKDKRGHIVNAPYVDNSYKWAGGGFLSTVGDLLKFGNAMLYSLQYRKLKTFQSEGSSAPGKAVDQTTKMLNNSNEQNNAISSGKIQEKSEEGLKVDPLQEKRTLNGKDNIMFEPLPGFLKSKTVEDIWCPVDKTELSWDKNGKYAMGWGVVSEKQQCKYCELQRFYVSHTGGAIGASSVLLILPRRCHADSTINCHWQLPPKGIIVVILTNLRGVALNKTALEIAKIFDNTSL